MDGIMYSASAERSNLGLNKYTFDSYTNHIVHCYETSMENEKETSSKM